MTPDDENGKLPPGERPLRVLLISGSQRRQYNCPGVDSKSRSLMMRMAARLPPEWEIDCEDLGNVFARARIQSCNACVSTSMALCCWPCNCYEPGNRKEPDLMWNLDLYSRLDLADAWAIIGPVNWYAPSSTTATTRRTSANPTSVPFDAWTADFISHVRAKGGVPPGKYRAYGYKRPAHRWADAKLWWRDRRMRLGIPRRGSSPAEQEKLGLNHSANFPRRTSTQSPRTSRTRWRW